jgi:hypothetical protein
MVGIRIAILKRTQRRKSMKMKMTMELRVDKCGKVMLKEMICTSGVMKEMIQEQMESNKCQ